MRWPLITRRRHDRIVVSQAIVAGREIGQAQRDARAAQIAAATPLRAAAPVANARVAQWLNGRADAHDLDADHMDGREPHQQRTVAKPTATGHRIVADILRECARDVEARGH